MKTLTPIFAALAISFAATTAVADGQADRYDEERTYPHKTVQRTVQPAEMKAECE